MAGFIETVTLYPMMKDKSSQQTKVGRALQAVCVYVLCKSMGCLKNAKNFLWALFLVILLPGWIESPWIG